MPSIVSSQTLDAIGYTAKILLVCSESMAGTLEVEDGLGVVPEHDIAIIRRHWPDVTARDLLVAGVTLMFAKSALDGKLPRLEPSSFCSSLMKTTCENLRCRGLGEA